MAPKFREGDKVIAQYTNAELAKLPDESEWARVDAMTDSELTENALSDPDSAPADAPWDLSQAVSLEELIARQNRRKQSVTIRLKPTTLDFFKGKGKGYQTKISALLDYYVEQEQQKQGLRGVAAFKVAKHPQGAKK